MGTPWGVSPPWWWHPRAAPQGFPALAGARLCSSLFSANWEGCGGFGLPKDPTRHGRIDARGAAEHPSPQSLHSAEGTQCPQTPADTEVFSIPGDTDCFVYREFSSCKPSFSHFLPFSPVPTQQHSRLTCATQSRQGGTALQKGLWTSPGWSQWRIQLGKTPRVPSGRQTGCLHPCREPGVVMQWVLPHAKPQSWAAASQLVGFCYSHIFFDSVDNRRAKRLWVLQHRAEITASAGSVRLGGLISSAQVVCIYSRSL